MARVPSPTPASSYGGLETNEADARRELVWARPAGHPVACGGWLLDAGAGDLQLLTRLGSAVISGVSMGSD